MNQNTARLLPLTLIVLSITACTSSTPTVPGTSTSASEPAVNLHDARAIHDRILVIDAHADIEMPGNPSRYAGKDGLSRVAPEKMRAGGVDAVVMTIAAGPGPRNATGFAKARELAAEKLAVILEMTQEPNDGIVLARSPDELVLAHKNGDLALILGFQNALILGKDMSALDDFYAAGVRVFALTHLGHNDYADSSRPLFIGSAGVHEPEAEHGGLSAKGKAAIKRINELGGIVDVSQLSKQATLQVLEMSSAPVIASHSNVRQLSDVSRNLSDEEIDRFGENGGVIHLSPFRGYLFDSSDEKLEAEIRTARREAGIKEDYYYPFELYWEIDDPEIQQTFLSKISDLLGPGSVDALVDHLDYVVNRIGVDHVGIGTDFNHGSGIEGFEDASEAFNVTRTLLKRGYTQEEVEKIWGGNFLRVFRQAQREATAQPAG